MAPITFSGTIPSKKKADLQAIAIALHISETGTREDLQVRIKRHLEQYQSKYEDDPTFSGLYGKRKKSVQPPLGRFVPHASTPEKSDQFDLKHEKTPQVTRTRRVIAIDNRETTPVSDIRDVSIILNNIDPSPTPSSPKLSPHNDQHKPDHSTPLTLTSTHKPVPPTLFKTLPQVVGRSITHLHITTQHYTRSALLTTRAVLSNSTNIWSLTALIELIYVLYMVIPWQTARISSSPSPSSIHFYLAIPYPPLHTFLQPSFWTVLLHWSIPTFFIPLIFGVLVSFHPANSTSARVPRVLALDPLSASIARLAAHVVYPFHIFDITLQGVDVIGQRYRLLIASVVVAFAFSDAIFSAPSAFAESRARFRAGTPRRTFASEDTLVSVRGES